MKWPRGKYNGRRIGGFRIDFEFNLCWWAFSLSWNWCYKNIHIGPFHWWFGTAYEK